MNAMRATRQPQPCKPGMLLPAYAGLPDRCDESFLGATDNSPQTNHIKTISCLFPCSDEILSVRGPAADAHLARALHDPLRAPDGETPTCAADFTPAEIAAAPARQVLRTRVVEGWMPDQDELDAMTKAWTFAVLDALEAADEKTKLEIVRILCPAGFVIVPTETAQLPNKQKN
jgi:hypothetical protein